MRKDLSTRHDEIVKWIADNETKTFICEQLKCRPATLHTYLKTALNIVYSGNQGGKGKVSKTKLTPEEYANSSCVKSHILKLKLIEYGRRPHQCEICKLTEWMGKPIPLELDHIDGNRFNNDLLNVRIICHNCHALTPTFCRPLTMR